jgi:capping protein (actin filament) muscle Z-line, beta
VGEGSKKMKGAWDSIHVIEVNETHGKATYKLTSTVMLYMKTNKPGHGEMNLSGSMTRQVESKDTVVDEANPHIANMGRLIEDMEIKMRSSLQVQQRPLASAVRFYTPCHSAMGTFLLLSLSLSLSLALCLAVTHREVSCRAQEIYFGKTKDIVNDLRSIRALSDSKAATDMTNELVAKLRGKAK